jgi:A/G-specific adenine glycosylase
LDSSDDAKVYNTTALPNPIVRRTETWFRKAQRPLPWRRGYQPYQVWISEVMAQQTRLEVVLSYFERFVDRFPTVEALADASLDDVTAAWSGLGYYRRARMLRDGAIDVMARFGGRLPTSVGELLTISGIGRYTAGAISSIAFGRRAPIVDGNIARIVARLFAIEHPLRTPLLMAAAWKKAEELVMESASPRDFNQGLMEIGALICTPRNPACGDCPLRRCCAAFAGGRVGELPRPKAKAATRAMTIPLYLIRDRRGRLLMRRERGPLMLGMLHLPHGDNSPGDWLGKGASTAVRARTAIGSFRHTVTTRRIVFELFAATGHRRTSRDEWIDPARLDSYPHPSYVRKALRLAGICN